MPLPSDSNHYSLVTFVLCGTKSASQRYIRTPKCASNAAYPVATEERMWRLWADLCFFRSVSRRLVGVHLELRSRLRKAAQHSRTSIRWRNPHSVEVECSTGVRQTSMSSEHAWPGLAHLYFGGLRKTCMLSPIPRLIS